MRTAKIFTTDRNQGEQGIAAAAGWGAIDYLSKPLDLTVFASRIPGYIQAPPRTTTRADAQ